MCLINVDSCPHSVVITIAFVFMFLSPVKPARAAIKVRDIFLLDNKPEIQLKILEDVETVPTKNMMPDCLVIGNN